MWTACFFFSCRSQTGAEKFCYHNGTKSYNFNEWFEVGKVRLYSTKTAKLKLSLTSVKEREKCMSSHFSASRYLKIFFYFLFVNGKYSPCRS